MVRERSDPVPAEPQALRRRRSGACSECRPAQTARIRGGDARHGTPALPPRRERVEVPCLPLEPRCHGVPRAGQRNSRTDGLAACPGSCRRYRPPRLGRPTFDGRRRDRGARERRLGISERRACKPTARHHRIAVLRLSALLTSHRMAGGWTRTDRHDPPVPAQGRAVRRPRARNRPRLRRHRWSPGRPSRHRSSPAGAPPPWSAPPG